MFGGKYYKCLDNSSNVLAREIIKNKNECETNGYRWKNSRINFDNVGNAYLALFQVVGAFIKYSPNRFILGFLKKK